MEQQKFKEAAAAVREVMANINEGVIYSGYDLKNKCVKLNPALKNMYVETFLREMRAFCHDDYILFKRSESLYKKITPSREESKNKILAKNPLEKAY